MPFSFCHCAVFIPYLSFILLHSFLGLFPFCLDWECLCCASLVGRSTKLTNIRQFLLLLVHNSLRSWGRALQILFFHWAVFSISFYSAWIGIFHVILFQFAQVESCQYWSWVAANCQECKQSPWDLQILCSSTD